MAYDAVRERLLYIADSGNQVIRSYDLANDIVSTLVGVPRSLGYTDDGVDFAGVDAAEALLRSPSAVALGPGANGAENGSLYIADTDNHRIRRYDFSTNLVTTVLGDGSPVSSGIGAPARFLSVNERTGPHGG